MRLIQQSKLFFREGNSDKVYEIDLCELSATEYLVNFRYGRRGSVLKEGTKTPAALSREKADVLFADLENEKRKKGYQTEIEVFVALPELDAVEPDSAKGAIMQRLQDAALGKNSFKTIWKTSRVIWKAGVLQLEEAIPFIIKLATKGDEMQTYSALWALTQLKAVQATQLFQVISSNSKQKDYLRNLAMEGLLSVTGEEELNTLRVQLLERLPVEVQYAIEGKDLQRLAKILQEHIQADHLVYISDLYLLSKIYPQMLRAIQDTLTSLAFRPPYFKHIRAIYKLAQLRKDAATMALLAYRFEREPAMFKRSSTANSNYKQYFSVIEQSVSVSQELKSKESKLAFSHFTKAYFQKNAVEFLKTTGEVSDARTYLRFAVAALLQYKERDYTPAEEKVLNQYGRYDSQTKRFGYTLFQYPECADALLLTTILFGKDSSRKLQSNLKYITGTRSITSAKYYYSADDVSNIDANTNSAVIAQRPTEEAPSVISAARSIFKSLFGKKQEPVKQEEINPASAPVEAVVNPVENPRMELFPNHWDEVPEAYVQLLMQAQMNIIHSFAYHHLKSHPDFDAIVGRFDDNALLKLLNSQFDLPNQLGFELLEKNTSTLQSQAPFVAAVLSSNSVEARNWARQLIASNPAHYFEDLEFILLFIFNPREETKAWIAEELEKASFEQSRLQAILGKAITELLHLDKTPENEILARTVISRIDIFAGQELGRLSWSMVEQLISWPLEANKILAGKILLLKSASVAASEIPISLTSVFLDNELPEVRQHGIQLFRQYPEDLLIQHIDFVLLQVTGQYKEVSVEALNVIRKLLLNHQQLGNTVLQYLTYAMIRKERFETAHELFSDFFLNELKPYWYTGLKPKEITKLIHAQYRIAQLRGYDVLKTYPNPDEFTLRQIISFGSHEILAIRTWCWNYFKQNLNRIRQEKTQALYLLDSKWDDTRAYAFHFFRTEFTESDWDADVLITIVDSVRPDVENFGKELITQYFNAEHALEYLSRLSEHPSVNVQAFVTNYLAMYAAGNLSLLQQLDFYFRSVLSRVNQARVAKDRIFKFLQEEGLKSEAAAEWVSSINDDIAAQSTIQDKATCIHILTEIKNQYPKLDMHLMIKN